MHNFPFQNMAAEITWNERQHQACVPTKRFQLYSFQAYYNNNFQTYYTVLNILHDLKICQHKYNCEAGIAVFTHGPQGPGPRAANFQGRHIKKKSRLKYGMRKKKAVHEREI